MATTPRKPTVIKGRIILGIDPGTTVMGYGILKVLDNKPELMAMGVLKLNKYDDHYVRLQKIFNRCMGLIEEFLPDELAIEAPFFGKKRTVHAQTGARTGYSHSRCPFQGHPHF